MDSGMMSLVQYTPLESLLIFQGLTAWGTQPDAFAKVSDSLHDCAFLKRDKSDANERWSPRAVEHLYLDLLAVESAHESKEATQNEETTVPNSKKRKASSPTLQAPNEALKHAHLMPGLVSKLYIRYRDEAARAIKEDEAKYEALVKDARMLEEGGVATASDAPGELRSGPSDLSSQQLSSETAGLQPEMSGNEVEIAATHINGGIVMRDTLYEKPPVQLSKDDADTEWHMPASDQVPSIDYVKSLQNASAGLDLVSRDGRPRPLEASLDRSLEPLPPLQAQNDEPMNRMPHHDFTQPPYAPDLSGTAHSPLTQARSETTSLHAHPTQPFETQTPHPQSLQRRPSQNMPPLYPPINLLPRPQAPPTLLPYPQQPINPYIVQQPGGSWSQSPYNPQHPANMMPTPPPRPIQPPHRGGIMLPPFQVSPQIPASVQNQGRVSSSLLPSPYSIKIDTNVPASRVASATQTPTTAPRKPKSRLSQVLPLKPDVVISPGSSTAWKIMPASQNFGPVPRPRPRSLSPMETDIPNTKLQQQHKTPSATPKQLVERKKKGKASKATLKEAAKESSIEPLDEASIPAAARKTSSIAETIQRGRTRSQSVVSQPEQTSVVISTAKVSRVKDEPSTPAASGGTVGEPSEEAKPVRLTSRGIPARSHQAKRPKTPLTSPAPTTPAASTVGSFSNTTSKQAAGAGTAPTILASRNFSRMTAPIMNNITSHKHASIFANPVKERDAEGYASMIRRPQDLKSIRNAISAGSRAVVAASALLDSVSSKDGGATAASNDSPGAAGTSSSMVTLPAAPDLFPPRGIVNAAQLEQEIMRMFANAVMFNPGDAGVVNDTREMFGTVEPAVAKWRAADRTTTTPATVDAGDKGRASAKVDDEADELGQDESALVTPSAGLPAKRRRL